MIRAKIILGLLSNLIFSLTIVLLNKWLYQHSKFPNITLTFLHFVTTSVFIYLTYLCGFFKRKHVSLLEILPLSLCFCGFVVFTNLSLENNTVGTYQLCKVLTTPFIMFLQTKYYNKQFSNAIKLTMLPIIIGVLINSYYDLEFNHTGAVYAGLGVLVTSFYQILVGAKQKDLNINSQQLLLYQAPVSAIFLLICVLIFENPWNPDTGILHPGNFNWNHRSMILIAASSSTSFFVNISIYYVIGKTSAVTYNMFGHFKFVCTMVAGFVIFKDPISFRRGMGIVLTCVGIGFYTKFKLSEGRKESKNRRKLLPGGVGKTLKV